MARCHDNRKRRRKRAKREQTRLRRKADRLAALEASYDDVADWYALDHDDDYSEPVGSCEWCGTNLYEDDDEELCDQCLWHAQLN